MAPSRAAQAHVMRRAYDAAGVDPATVDYVEAHGTGTPVGDVVEAGALSDVFGAGRPPARSCLIGSIKPNVGHLEAAAGVAGVVKTVLAMNRAEIPPSLLVSGRNAQIPWGDNGLELVAQPTRWPDGDGPRTAGVASYGYGGTLAHVVLEEAPHSADPEPPDGGLALYPVSGSTEQAARANAQRLARWLEARPEARLADVGRTLGRHRSHLGARITVVAADHAELVAGLATAVPTASVAAASDPVWVFSGHGAQWAGMGSGLLLDEPPFAAVIDELDPVYREEMGFSLRAAIAAGHLQDVGRTQATTYALQVAMTAVWRSYGLRPAAVIGHSVGEIAAAVAAGVLAPVDGARLVCRRSLLVARAAGSGAMAMVALPFDEVSSRLAGEPDVDAAIEASSGTTVVSGEPDVVARVSAAFEAEGLGVRQVASDVAFHSPQMQPLCDELVDAVADLPSAAAAVTLYTTALDDPRDDSPRDASYWARNLREPVRFAAAVAAAAHDGHRVFLEISTHPVVGHSIAETAPGAVVVHTLRRDKPERRTLLDNAGVLHRHGVTVDWAALHPHGRLSDLPTNAWQRRPHWVEHRSPKAAIAGHDPASHTLLGGQTTVHGSTDARVWRTRLDHAQRPYPGDHGVLGAQVVPASVVINTLLAAAAIMALRDVQLLVPLLTAPEREVQVVAQSLVLRIASSVDGEWTTHSSALVDLDARPLPAVRHRPAPDIDAAEEEPDIVVRRLAQLGVSSIGFPWRIDALRRDAATLSATITIDPGGTLDRSSWAVVLDAVFSAAPVVFGGAPVLRMPASVAQMIVAGEAPRRARLHVRISGDESVDVDVDGLDGAPLARLRSLRFGRPEGEPDHVPALTYEVVWSPLVARSPDGDGNGARVRRVALVSDDAELRAALSNAGLLGGDGHRGAVVVSPGANGEPAEAAMRACAVLAEAVRDAAGNRVWCVTRGARQAADERGLAQSALWGLARVAAAERPECWGGIVDLPAQAESRDLDALLPLLLEHRDEDVMAIEGGAITTARLAPSLTGRPGAGAPCRPDGTYVIAGGAGAVGLRIARWLSARGARRIVLVGRSAPSRAAREVRRALESAGVTVRILTADTCDRDAMSPLLDPDALGLTQVRGVVHAAAVFEDRFIAQLDEPSLRAVMRPKIVGATVLHELFPPGCLDFFVMCSSAGHLLHLPAQAPYAAGNAYLEGLVRHRRALGCRASLAIAWTAWRGVRATAASAVIGAQLHARGTDDITVDEALRSWDLVDPRRSANVAVLRVRGAGRVTPLLRDLASQAPAAAPADWTLLDGDDRLELLATEVRHAAAEALGVESGAVDDERPLTEQGVDSLLSFLMLSTLDDRLGLELPPTLLWRCPTVVAIAALIADQGAPA